MSEDDRTETNDNGIETKDIQYGGKVLSVEEAQGLDVIWREGPREHGSGIAMMTCVYKGQRVFITKQTHAKLGGEPVGVLAELLAPLNLRSNVKKEFLEKYENPADVVSAGAGDICEISGIGPALAAKIIEACGE